MTHRPYPAYKDSGIEWLGDVPEHWEVVAFRRVVDIAEGQVDPEKEPYSTMNLIAPNHIEGSTGHLLEMETAAEQSAESGKYLCKAGDVIYSKIRPALRKACMAPVDCLCSADMYPLSGRPCLSNRYLLWTILSEEFSAYTILESDRVAMPKINRDSLNGVSMLLPSLPEQHAIAAFLDRETAKIDALVAEQERMIAILTEKRQAVISHAVTKGLDPSVPLKDSGVEWLGEIPEHWEVKPLMRLTDSDRPIMYGIVLPGPDVEGGIPILKGGNVRPSRMNLESVSHTTAEIELPYARARLKAGDLVYSIRGSIGDCEAVPVELEGANITQDVARVSIADEYCPSWARWALLSSAVRESLASGSLGAAIRGVNIFDLKRARIPTPPADEQRVISAFLDEQTARFDSLIAEAQRGIELLKERRTALISAAVTGKIDVRD